VRRFLPAPGACLWRDGLPAEGQFLEGHGALGNRRTAPPDPRTIAHTSEQGSASQDPL